MTEKEKKLRGEELAAKIREELDRIRDETGEEPPHKVFLRVEEKKIGKNDVPGVTVDIEDDDPIFIPDFCGLGMDEVANFASELAGKF